MHDDWESDQRGWVRRTASNGPVFGRPTDGGRLMSSSHAPSIASQILPSSVWRVGQRLRGLATDLGIGAVGDGAEAETASTETRADGDDEVLEPARGSSPSNLAVETGLTPDEYVLTALTQGGGRLWQQEVIAHTGWSAPTVSRLLQEMESSGKVVRIWIGRQKLVHLPESAPESALSTPHDAVA